MTSTFCGFAIRVPICRRSGADVRWTQFKRLKVGILGFGSPDRPIKTSLDDLVSDHIVQSEYGAIRESVYILVCLQSHYYHGACLMISALEKFQNLKPSKNCLNIGVPEDLSLY